MHFRSTLTHGRRTAYSSMSLESDFFAFQHCFQRLSHLPETYRSFRMPANLIELCAQDTARLDAL